MTALKLCLVSAFLFSSAATLAKVHAADREIIVQVSDVYVPSGFNRDSDIYVVVTGLFPNSCYRWNRAVVRHPSDFAHEVISIASVSPGPCMMVLVPFSKEVRLGKFKSGKHQVRFLNGDGTYLEKSMDVE